MAALSTRSMSTEKTKMNDPHKLSTKSKLGQHSKRSTSFEYADSDSDSDHSNNHKLLKRRFLKKKLHKPRKTAWSEEESEDDDDVAVANESDDEELTFERMVALIDEEKATQSLDDFRTIRKDFSNEEIGVGGTSKKSMRKSPTSPKPTRKTKRHKRVLTLNGLSGHKPERSVSEEISVSSTNGPAVISLRQAHQFMDVSLALLSPQSEQPAKGFLDSPFLSETRYQARVMVAKGRKAWTMNPNMPIINVADWVDNGVTDDLVQHLNTYASIVHRDALECAKCIFSLHGALSKGSPHVVQESYITLTPWLTSLRDVWRFYQERFDRNSRSRRKGRMLEMVCKVLSDKLQFHKNHPNFEGNYALYTYLAQLRDSGKLHQLELSSLSEVTDLLLLQQSIIGATDVITDDLLRGDMGTGGGMDVSADGGMEEEADAVCGTILPILLTECTTVLAMATYLMIRLKVFNLKKERPEEWAKLKTMYTNNYQAFARFCSTVVAHTAYKKRHLPSLPQKVKIGMSFDLQALSFPQSHHPYRHAVRLNAVSTPRKHNASTTTNTTVKKEKKVLEKREKEREREEKRVERDREKEEKKREKAERRMEKVRNREMKKEIKHYMKTEKPGEGLVWDDPDTNIKDSSTVGGVGQIGSGPVATTKGGSNNPSPNSSFRSGGSGNGRSDASGSVVNGVVATDIKGGSTTNYKSAGRAETVEAQNSGLDADISPVPTTPSRRTAGLAARRPSLSASALNESAHHHLHLAKSGKHSRSKTSGHHLAGGISGGVVELSVPITQPESPPESINLPQQPPVNLTAQPQQIAQLQQPQVVINAADSPPNRTNSKKTFAQQVSRWSYSPAAAAVSSTTAACTATTNFTTATAAAAAAAATAITTAAFVQSERHNCAKQQPDRD
eukprot:TRINITY_DN780_c1_g1_i2.p1 TRINITY_DN780_c1_g1~~TRINITY_DN780_c1_g1_i2.p1  ORF type:complete len:901 (+),score=173.48 TRINITY_DN780_c1_g1_i2:199-2901(+)